MCPFDPLENIKKPKVFGCFQGFQKGTLRKKSVKKDVKEDAREESENTTNKTSFLLMQHQLDNQT